MTRNGSIDTIQLKSNLLLFLTALIWGFAFVAQRAGMDHIGPFAFNGIRFALGAASLIPLLLFNRKKKQAKSVPNISWTKIIGYGVVTGLVLFFGSTLQQVGIVYTTAGNAGFITGLYVIIVPFLGMLWKQKSESGTWLGAFLAVIGLYLLSVTEQLTISQGDALVFGSAFFWAAHVHLIGFFSRRVDPLTLAFLQFISCSILSLLSTLLFENLSFQMIHAAAFPIVYAGLFSVGVAYTLQVIAQQHAHPANAAIILSLEAVFAVLGGWLLLHEALTIRGYLGCFFMLLGMVSSQLGNLVGKIKSMIVNY